LSLRGGDPAAAIAEPFAHGFREPQAEHAHVIWDFVRQTLLATFRENGLALYSQFLGELIDSNAFAQNGSPKST
jgi:hypothetical protein